MGWNPFSTASNYPQMLRKIAMFTFACALLAVSLVRAQVPDVDSWLSRYSIQVPLFGGVSLPFGTILPALAVALLFRMFKVHDRISDLFRIRHTFDVNHIIKPMALGVGIVLSKVALVRVRNERQEIMHDVFYRYASGTEGKAAIDSHYVTLALDQWSWFWIVLEAEAIALLTAIVLLIAGVWFSAGVLIAADLVVIGVLRLIWQGCTRYARAEIDQILDDEQRKHDIARAFHALQGETP